MGESKDASEGEVWLYNPDLEKVGTWEISSLQCLNHENECDGLHAVYEEGHDTRHALLVPVPVSMMEYAGTYIFVLHIKDNHPELYRDHQHRWTLELNTRVATRGYAVILKYWLGALLASHVRECLEHPAKQYLGYREFPHPRDADDGGSGYMAWGNAPTPEKGLHSLNAQADNEAATEREHCAKNDVWVYIGHGSCDILEHQPGSPKESYLDFAERGDDAGLSGYHRLRHDPAWSAFRITNYDLTHIVLAFLGACYSAGGDRFPDRNHNVTYDVSQSESIANAFLEAGVRVVVGFRNKVRLQCGGSAFAFSWIFWNCLSRGETVKQAKEHALRSFWCYGNVPVRVLGDENTRIFPQRK